MSSQTNIDRGSGACDGSADLQTVRDWIHRNGPCPTDTEFWFAFCAMLNEWKEQRRNGLDVLASVALDEMAETVEAMRDL